MIRVRVAITAAAIALGGQLNAGCGTTEPYVQRDPAGPCLQRPLRRAGKSYVSTLWRGDEFVGNIGTGADGLYAAVARATTDNPAASAEAQAGQRAHRAASPLMWGAPLAAMGVLAAGVLAAHQKAPGTYLAGGAAIGVDVSMLLAGDDLESSAYAHAKKAIEIYNADPPPGCGAPPPDASAPEAQ